MEPDDVLGYGRQIAATLSEILGDELVGAYFVGSVALGGYVPSESDIDMVAVSRLAIPDQLKTPLAEAVFNTTGFCPARGLEFTLYRGEVAASPPSSAGFEINVNGGPRMDRDIHLDAGGEPGFWYVIDRAIANRCGVSIYGPPPGQVFGPVSRRALLVAMTESMRWHRDHEKATLYSVLNATRAWRFAVENILGSKLEGAAWARERWFNAAVIDAAVELRHGRQGVLGEHEVNELLDRVETVLLNAEAA